MTFEIFDIRDNRVIDGGLTLEWGIDLLRYYHNRRGFCSYGLRPTL